MTERDRIRKLKVIADLMRERDLAGLSRAQSAKTRTEDLLRALDRSSQPTLPDTTSAARAQEKYGLWSTNRRIALNQQHARETAAWLAERESAQRSFGQSEVLRRLLERK